VSVWVKIMMGSLGRSLVSLEPRRRWIKNFAPLAMITGSDEYG
jgi:hypothetical protein